LTQTAASIREVARSAESTLTLAQTAQLQVLEITAESIIDLTQEAHVLLNKILSGSSELVLTQEAGRAGVYSAFASNELMLTQGADTSVPLQTHSVNTLTLGQQAESHLFAVSASSQLELTDQAVLAGEKELSASNALVLLQDAHSGLLVRSAMDSLSLEQSNHRTVTRADAISRDGESQLELDQLATRVLVLGAGFSRSAEHTLDLVQAATLADRTFSHGTRASAHNRRIPISMRDISSENMATARSASTATLRAMLVTKDDFPSPGRAAMTTRFPGWSPWRRLSTSENPVGMPENACSRSCIFSSVSMDSWTRSLRGMTSSLSLWRETA
jgi:hypothetical protein